jgi:hypothetical protein
MSTTEEQTQLGSDDVAGIDELGQVYQTLKNVDQITEFLESRELNIPVALDSGNIGKQFQVCSLREQRPNTRQPQKLRHL